MVKIPTGFCAPQANKGGTDMKIKSIFPYLLFGSLLFIPNGTNKSAEKNGTFVAQQTIKDNTPDTQELIDAKAQELIDIYIANVLAGQNRIKHGKGGHRAAVLREFPGAVVRYYCIYGQYTQFNRALYYQGDTLTLIPFGARHSCPEFRRLMTEKYKDCPGVIHNGKMFKSNKDYNNALNAFLKRNHVDENTPDSVRQKVIDKFNRNNFSAESLHPGAILIVQKSSTPSNTHAIMFLGIGRMENGKFIPDAHGTPIYAGYNNESTGDIYGTYPTNRIMAADMFVAAQYGYTKEFQKVQDMNYDEMFHYVYEEPYDGLYAFAPDNTSLRQTAAAKYFSKDKQDFKPATKPVRMQTASVTPPLPQIQQLRAKNFIRNLGVRSK